MLSDYKGPANSPEVLKHLVGEKVTAAFQDNQGKIHIVLGSGLAIAFASVGGDGCGPSYWVEDPDKVKQFVEQRRKQIERNLAELRDLPGVELP